ncbi:MAG: membrane protein insertase YidC [Hyphomonadaceae bacterium]|nr:membrane protein insertase YidC [Hyphomonadaceae bacterium]
MPPNAPNDPDQTRNLIIAMVLMLGCLFAYQTFYVGPQREAQRAAQEAAAEREAQLEAEREALGIEAPVIAPTVEAALETDIRVPFDGPSLDGSINLTGARIDDLNLKRHFLTVDREEELRLMRPANSESGYFATYGWQTPGSATEAPQNVIGLNSNWELVSGTTLTPDSPITLQRVNGPLRFERTIAVDDDYMFTYTDTITNTLDQPFPLRPFGVIQRYGDYKAFLDATDPGSAGASAIVHQGLIGVLDNDLKLRSYKNLSKGKGIKGDTNADAEGWIGFTDKYWMAALVPQQGASFSASFDLSQQATGEPLYQVKTEGSTVTVPAGGSITVEHRIFAGAKELAVLRGYEEDLSLARFDDAIDWGFLYFLTKPFFNILVWLESMLGSFGWAILAFTVLVKTPLIPLYNQSYKAMAKMKKLSEPMKEIQEKYKDNPQERQKQIMALYQREKANPLAGCLPILATIPIFYALYKTLFVTLEMRHESFGYIRDLSAPDPLAIGNLFGLLPWAASDIKAIPIIGIVLGIGLLPILYGLTMAALQSLNPPPTDPMQKTVMRFLPIILTFVFGGFAVGLVLYWVWNNMLSLLQQYFIMRRNGVETELDKLIARLRGRKGDAPAE